MGYTTYYVIYNFVIMDRRDYVVSVLCHVGILVSSGLRSRYSGLSGFWLSGFWTDPIINDIIIMLILRKSRAAQYFVVTLNMKKRTCAFTVNGTKYPEVSRWNDLPSKLYPVVSLYHPYHAILYL